MEKHKLSHKELVKLGLHESSRGRSLSQIEAGFRKLGIGRNDSIRALKTVDYMKKREERKAAQEKAKSENNAATKNGKAAGTGGKNKSNFLFWFLILLILLGIVYLFYEGILSLGMFGIDI